MGLIHRRSCPFQVPLRTRLRPAEQATAPELGSRDFLDKYSPFRRCRTGKPPVKSKTLPPIGWLSFSRPPKFVGLIRVRDACANQEVAVKSDIPSLVAVAKLLFDLDSNSASPVTLRVKADRRQTLAVFPGGA